MNSTSNPPSLGDRAEALTQRNHGSNPPRPPAVASSSPIHEILVQEAAASLPSELRTRMEAEPSVERVMDWLGAAAVARWIRNDPVAKRTFLQEVSADPATAGLALARGLAARMEPPTRDAAWQRADRVGLVWQLLFAVGVLLLRIVLFAALSWVGGLSPFISPEMRVLSAFGLGLVIFSPLESLLGVVLTACAGVWLLGEAFLVPPLMERVRQAPARRKGLAPPLSWRVDAFEIVWRGQAVGWMTILASRLFGTIWPPTGLLRLEDAGLGMGLPLVLGACLLLRRAAGPRRIESGDSAPLRKAIGKRSGAA